MPEKWPCPLCGELKVSFACVYCRPCRERLKATPTTDLLEQLDEAVLQAISAAARDAVARLASERIYGFFLLHYIFSSCNAAVLTDAKYEVSLREHAEWAAGRAPEAPASVLDRWMPVDSGHYFYREDLFVQTGHLFSALEGRQQEAEVARIFVRAMRRVREDILADPRIVLSVMDYTEGPSGRFYAYAELFNDAATLAHLKEELCPGPEWDDLDLEQCRAPS